MPFIVPIDTARSRFPDYEFVAPLTASEQKSAFHVRKNAQDYCLKIIAPNYALNRLQREVLAMEAIDHPNVVRLIEYEYSAKLGQERHYLVEEFIAGTDLTSHLTPGSSWPLSKIIEVFGKLCDGLEHLRAKEIVHRDLKPSNIRVRGTGDPVIIDFGLARILNMESVTLTAEGAMFGTPLYFAPEQFLGTKRDIDHRTDLYALGVLMFEAAVGSHPSVTGKVGTFQDLSDAVCLSESFAAIPAFKALPDKLQLILRRLLAKERSKRPSEAATVAKLLRGLGAA